MRFRKGFIKDGSSAGKETVVMPSNRDENAQDVSVRKNESEERGDPFCFAVEHFVPLAF